MSLGGRTRLVAAVTGCVLATSVWSGGAAGATPLRAGAQTAHGSRPLGASAAFARETSAALAPPSGSASDGYVVIQGGRLTRTTVAAHGTVHLDPFNAGGIPPIGVAAVRIRLTVQGAAAAGSLVAYPHGLAVPRTTSVSFSKGHAVNTTIDVAPGHGGDVDVVNRSAGKIVLTATALGYHPIGAAEPRTALTEFVPVSPRRLASLTLTPRHETRAETSGPGGVPTTGPGQATAVVLSLTVVAPRHAGSLFAYPFATTRPAHAAEPLVPGRTGTVEVTLATDRTGVTLLYDQSASPVAVRVDVVGYLRALRQVPTSPTEIQGVGHANGAFVSWRVPDDGGSPITGYLVTASPGNYHVTVSGPFDPSGYASTDFPGLVNGVAYVFDVRAQNAIGWGADGSAVDPTAVGAPPPPPPAPLQAPWSASAAVTGPGTVTVSWQVPDDAAAEGITGYQVTTLPGGTTTTAAGTTVASTVVSGLSPASSYVFSVRSLAGSATSWDEVDTDVSTTPGAPAVGHTALVSVDDQGSAATVDTYTGAATSADGRYVAFSAYDFTSATNDLQEAVYLRDVQTGRTTDVSVTPQGSAGDGTSDEPAVSADGRYVAFASTSDNLVPGDTNGHSDVFVRDRQTGTTVRASVTTAEVQADDDSDQPSISADGRSVAFSSLAANLAAGDTNGHYDVFVRDLQAGTTTRVSVPTTGNSIGGDSFAPSLSADGTTVAFTSNASDMVSNDLNSADDVFVRNLQAATTVLVSTSTAGVRGDHASFGPVLSANGQFLVFDSLSTNLGTGAVSGQENVYRRNLSSGATTQVSVDATGGQLDEDSGGTLGLSADGRYVLFTSLSDHVVATADTNTVADAFVRDTTAGTTALVSVGSDGSQGDADSNSDALSSDGSAVLLDSEATSFIGAELWSGGVYERKLR